MLKIRHLAVGVALTGLALSGCTSAASEGPAASVDPSTAASSASASSAASASPGTSWQPDTIRFKAIVQLDDPVNPSQCSAPAAAGKVGVGTSVTLSDGEGGALGTGALREPRLGEAYGGQGNTFDGWGDLAELNGMPVTYACFYVAEFTHVSPVARYVVSIDGTDVVESDQAQLGVNEGWINQFF